MIHALQKKAQHKLLHDIAMARYTQAITGLASTSQNTFTG